MAIAGALAAVSGLAACALTSETVAQSGPTGRTAHVDEMLRFRIDRPSDFVVEVQAAAKLSGFDPAPVASVMFMNPTMAAGDLAGLEPPDLELRVYAAAGARSLESWLEAARFTVGSQVARPYRRPAFTGLEICRSTLIAPGCSVFVLAGDRVYQLTPASVEGEAMIATFQPPP